MSVCITRPQEFDPQEFSSTLNESTQDADRGVVLNFMSSSHMPYILNRLQISLEADDEGKLIGATSHVLILSGLMAKIDGGYIPLMIIYVPLCEDY